MRPTRRLTNWVTKYPNKLITTLWVVVLNLYCPAALAQEGQQAVAVSLSAQNQRVLASFSIASIFTEDFKNRIHGGLESRVEVLTQLKDRNGAVVGSGQRSCKFLYLLWDETLYVSINDQSSNQPYMGKFHELEPALSACGKIQNLPVALTGAMTLTDGYILHITTILNPVSEEIVKRSRQFAANPRGSRSGSSKNLLMTLAGLFGRRGDTLGDVHELHSPPLRRPVQSKLVPTAKQGDSR